MGKGSNDSEKSPYPRTLADIEKGCTEPGHSTNSAHQPPAWLDKEKFRRGQAFFRNHAASLLLSLHCSVTTGFSIVNLLEPLVFTQKSDTPEKANKRYEQTTLYLLSWVMEEMWDDPKSLGFKSVQTVRKMHNFVGTSMNKKLADTGKLYVTQYDMGLVQSGFMGAIVMYPAGFGCRCTESDLEDYIHFWRGMGYLLGIDDKYNICAGDYRQTFDLCKSIEREKLLPGLEEPPKDFDKMVAAYIGGVNMMSRVPLHSFRSVLALSYEGMGLASVDLSFPDTLRYWFLKLVVFLLEWCPGFERLANRSVRSNYSKMVESLDLEAKSYSI